MQNNPLNTKIQLNKLSNPSFGKKKQVQVIEETSSRFIDRPQSIQAPQRPSGVIQSSDIEQIIGNPLFYRNLMKYNSKLISELTTELNKELFDSNKEYLQKLSETYMTTRMKKEMTDFKILFADFLKNFLQKQMNTSMQSGDIETLRKEVEALKLNTTVSNATINEDKSFVMDQQFKEFKDQIDDIKQIITEIRNNEMRLEQRLNSTLTSINASPQTFITGPEEHTKALERIEEQQLTIRTLKEELGINQAKIKTLESQIDFKFAALEQMVQRNRLDYSTSFTQLYDEANNYFHKEEVSFSVIKPKKDTNDDTQMHDVKELNNYMGSGLINRHVNFIAPNNPDKPASPKNPTTIINLENYNANYKKEVDTENKNSPYVESEIMHREYTDSELYPRRTNISPYTPEQIVKTSDALKGKIPMLKITKDDLEQSLVDIKLSENMSNDILIDEHGFVVDHNGFPILDAKGNLIKLSEEDVKNFEGGKLSV